MMLEDFGMMTEPMPENRVQYDLRALDKYCSEREVLPIDLSEEELKNLNFLRINQWLIFSKNVNYK